MRIHHVHFCHQFHRSVQSVCLLLGAGVLSLLALCLFPKHLQPLLSRSYFLFTLLPWNYYLSCHPFPIQRLLGIGGQWYLPAFITPCLPPSVWVHSPVQPSPQQMPCSFIFHSPQCLCMLNVLLWMCLLCLAPSPPLWSPVYSLAHYCLLLPRGRLEPLLFPFSPLLIPNSFTFSFIQIYLYLLSLIILNATYWEYWVLLCPRHLPRPSVAAVGVGGRWTGPSRYSFGGSRLGTSKQAY